jgi:hypothetical protein
MRSRLNASPKKAKVSRRERNLTLAFRRVNSHRLTALKCPYMLESACILNIKRYQVKIEPRQISLLEEIRARLSLLADIMYKLAES